MLKKAPYILLGVVALTVLVVLKLPDRAAARVKLTVGSLFLPLFGVAASGQHLVEKAGNAVASRADLLAQNEKFRLENQELRVRLAQSAELQRENDQLRRQFGFTRNTTWKVRPAHVIARDPANWWRGLWIDLGRRDGLREDLAVVTPEGLAGRLADVAETRSRVVLLGDPSCRVAVRVAEAQEHGVISAAGGVLNGSLVGLGCLSKSDRLKSGQLVETSGLGGVFPAGIRVGHILDLRSVDYGLATEARVKLLVNLNYLEEVWVMTP